MGEVSMFRRIACALVALSLTSVVVYGAEASDDGRSSQR